MKSLTIDCRPTVGFFSNLFQIIDNLKYCEMNNLKPILRLDGFSYSDGRDNIWNYYFEEINDSIPYQNNETSSFFKLIGNNFVLDNYHLLNLWNFIFDYKSQLNHRLEVNSIISKYIKPSKHISDIVNNFKGEKFSNTLGIHMRGTDYGFNNLDAYLNKINEIQKDKNYDNIYIMSDNFESIEIISKEYRNCFCYPTNLRMQKLSDPVLAFSVDNPLKHGEDVLVETYLLSMCKEIICVNSNVSAMALFLNPMMDCNLLHRSRMGG